MNKSIKVNMFAWIAAVVVLLVAVPINMIFSKVDVSFDMTPHKAFSLSEKAKSTLESITEPIDMYVLYDLDHLHDNSSPGDQYYMMADMYMNTVQAIAEYDNVTLHEVDITKDPEFVEEKDPEGYMNLSELDILLECGDNKRDISFRTLFVVNGETGSVEFYGENSIIGAIDYLQKGLTPTIYFATGHNETDISKYSQLTTQLKMQNYNSELLDIEKEGKIPEDATTVLFAGPKKDISDNELQILQEYMANGGNVTMFMAPNSEKVVYKNIEKLLATYEIVIDYNKVYEGDSNYMVTDDKYLFMCELADVDFNKALINEQGDIPVYILNSRSIYSTSGDDSKLKSEPLIQTINTAQSELCGGFAEDAKELSGILYLAAKVEDPTRNDSKLYIIGSSDFATDDTITEMPYTMPCIYQFLTTISWMDQGSNETVYPARIQATDYITIPDKKTGDIILVIMIAFPIIIAASGVVIWMRRRNA